MSKLTVANLGKLGVDVTRSPLHTEDGELLTAQNAEIRANQALSGIVKRLGLGQFSGLVGEVLQLVSFGAIPPVPTTEGGGEWGFGPIVWNIMRCKLYLTAATTSIADNSVTKVTWTAEAYDVGAMHDLVTNPSQIRCPPDGDGLYLVVGQAQWATLGATGTKKREIRILKNNTAVYGDAAAGADDDGDVFSHQVTALVPMVYGDYLEMSVEQDSGGALDLIGASEEKTWIALVRLVPTVTWELPRVHVYRTTDITLTKDTPQLIAFDAEAFDAKGMHDGGAPTKLTIPTDQGGFYFVCGQFMREATAVGYLHAELLKNGGTVLHTTVANFINATIEPDVAGQVVGAFEFDAGDYVELRLTYRNYAVGAGASVTIPGIGISQSGLIAARIG